jgi:hypothetical protein
MMRLLALVLLSAGVASACSICGGSFSTRTTLREKFSQAAVVVEGTLKNAKPNADDLGGTTEFHFGTVLKTTDKFKDTKLVVLPKYYPTIGSTPTKYLIFFDVSDAKLLMVHGVESTPAVLEYLQATTKFPKPGPPLLAHAFTQLEHTDTGVAGEAFLEFALANDADIAAAKKHYDPKKLLAWMNAKETPVERIGVYAILLGLCGDPTADAPAFRKWMTEERFSTQLSGLIAGWILLDAKAGWANLNAILADNALPFATRLSALMALRFLQATAGTTHRAEIVQTCGMLLKDIEFTDVIIDDLRRWAWWDHTETVLAVYTMKTSKTMKRTLIRYALQCPDKTASEFITKVRSAEPELVKKVEDTLKP